MANEASPIIKIRPISLKSGINPESFNLNSAFLEKIKNQITNTAPAPWPKIVATALPAMPQFNTKTNSQFSAIQTITLTTLVINAILGAPADLIKLFIPIPIDRKIKPKHWIWTNVFVPSHRFSGVPITERRKSINSQPHNAIITAKPINNKNELPKHCSTFFLSFFPRRIAASALPP